MNRIWFIVGFVFGLSGCSQIMDLSQDDIYDYIRTPSMEFESLNEAKEWIADNIEYASPDPYEWQSPYQTMSTRKGMCVDYATLLLWYAVKNFNANYKNSYILGVEENDGGGHALCVINGIVYEPEINIIRTEPYRRIVGKWNLDDALEVIYYEYNNRNMVMNIPKLD